MPRKIKVLGMKRKREHKTNYYKRLKLLKGRRTRLVVRVFSRSILGQFVDYAPKGDKVIVGVNSISLRDLGWQYNCCNLPSAYLAGLMLGKKGLEKGVKDAILDMGFHRSVPGSRVFAFVKGVIDAGVSVPISEEMLPKDSRLRGEHIAGYLKSAPKAQFTRYKKLKKMDIVKDFETVKGKILDGK
ncbi:50S ribosomal protein L18 [Candidatus Woesearchaeota archaeon]|nr:MAG: 50S ribosomal protein L18 [Candidatus Woesearchaeota archaeon]